MNKSYRYLTLSLARSGWFRSSTSSMVQLDNYSHRKNFTHDRQGFKAEKIKRYQENKWLFSKDNSIFHFVANAII